MDTSHTRESVIRFAAAVRKPDFDALQTAVVPDIVWQIPGRSLISGRHVGVAAVHGLAATLADHHYKIDVQALTFGAETVAVEVRGTGAREGREIDVAVVNVLGFDGELVSRVDTHFSDLEMVLEYFGPSNAH